MRTIAFLTLIAYSALGICEDTYCLRVVADDPDGISYGSGAYVHYGSNDYVITAWHVVKNSDEVYAGTLGHRGVWLTPIAWDADQDVCVMKARNSSIAGAVPTTVATNYSGKMIYSGYGGQPTRYITRSGDIVREAYKTKLNRPMLCVSGSARLGDSGGPIADVNNHVCGIICITGIINNQDVTAGCPAGVLLTVLRHAESAVTGKSIQEISVQVVNESPFMPERVTTDKSARKSLGKAAFYVFTSPTCIYCPHQKKVIEELHNDGYASSINELETLPVTRLVAGQPHIIKTVPVVVTVREDGVQIEHVGVIEKQNLLNDLN